MRFLIVIFILTCSLVPMGALAQAEEVQPIQAESEMPEESAEPVEEDYYDEIVTYVPPPVKPVARREIQEQAWTDAAKGMDFSKDLPEPPKPAKKPRDFDLADWNFNTAGIGKILQVIAIVLALAGIIFWMVKMLQAPKNRRIAQDGTLITAANIEDYIHETDLERFLREAVTSGNYPLAVRIYYLQIIKSLSEKGAIRWSKEKTNRDYLREMKEHRLGREFRSTTKTFEQIWYGNKPLDAVGYALLEPEFKAVLNQL
ncbi:MAG: DUF4129 domain-containing protein [Saprospiraceae bacterium]|nr:DUF4129 domain-containing protein [Saprospiraceae bacterium]